MRELAAGYVATRARRGALIVIAGNLAFFGALLAVMFYLRWASEEWPAPFHFASLLMVAALTMFGLCASVTSEVGARAAKLPDREPAVRWIAVAIASWLTFMFLEVVEWVRLVYLVRLGPDTAFGGTFLALTGAHWVAVCACIFWMGFAANDTRRRDALAPAMYSHFLNAWWILLVITLYLTNTNLEGIA
jgi:heme/copper-type cytochrome/quinol oxidase subunit 3